MQSLRLKLLLLAVSITFALQTNAQTCKGSLGDPVINQDFGAGASNPGPALNTDITNYMFHDKDCPNDGYYTIGNSTFNCFGDTWHTLTTDHTGNKNGYMMIVNASNNPGIFYVQKADAGQLCPNTTYEFAAYIVNLIVPSACGGASTQPNITFSIETTDGTVLKSYNTGDIPPTDDIEWKQYGTFFTTPANVTSVIVRMINNAPGGCGNDLALDDITFRACGPVIQSGFTTVNGPNVQPLCEHDNGVFNIKTKVISNTPPNLQWQLNTNNAGWVDISGQTADNIDVTFTDAKTGSYQYRLGVSNGSDISSVQCRVYSPPLTINVNPLPVVPPFPVTTVCEGYPLTLTASGGISYTWSGPGLAPTSQNPLKISNITPANAGTYTVQVTSDKGCAAPPVQAIVKVVPKVVAGVSNAVTVCAGEPAQLTASGGLYYKWTPSTGLDHDDIPNPVATPLQTTTYNVNVSNDGCNDDTKSITITVRQNPVADGGGNKKIFEGQSVILKGSEKGDEIVSHLWKPATGLDDPTSLTPVASPTDDITYTLTVVSQNCGTSTNDVFVRVYKKITIPNAFSPNNDGINDNWDIDALITYPESLMTVFNRYGQQVYQSTGYAKPWNGTYKSTQVPQGTYYYIIDLKNNTPKISGWVVIVR